MTKVFGIGMFKTGTTSLGHAFEILGYDAWYGPWKDPEVLPYQPWGVDLDEMRSHRSVLQGLIDRYDAFQDYPFMFIYPLVDAWYPGSKFILTTRDPEAVARSDQAMWRRQNLYDGEIPPAERFIERYERHLEAVRAYFVDRPGDLLEVDWGAGDGWPELCAFLGKDVPDRPFPQANKGAYTRLDRVKRKARRLAKRIGLSE